MVCIKPERIYVDIAKDVKARYGTSNWEFERLLTKAKKKKYCINEG